MTPLRDGLGALAFLTIVPIPPRWANPPSGAGLVWFPAVGLLIGITLWATALILQPVLGDGVSAVVLVALLAVLTGGLHLDGLADSFDGLGGARGDSARALEIMRDSSIGAHGATALTLALLLKAAAVGQLLNRDAGMALCVFPVVARSAIVPVMATFPYLREQGLGTAFEVDQPRRLGATVLGLGALVALWGGAASILASVVAVVVVLALASRTAKWLGGLTGDLYGAGIELGEIVWLLTYLVGLHVTA